MNISSPYFNIENCQKGICEKKYHKILRTNSTNRNYQLNSEEKVLLVLTNLAYNYVIKLNFMPSNQTLFMDGPIADKHQAVENGE